MSCETSNNNQIWKFTNPEHRDGIFTLPNPDSITGLYYPLGNTSGMMSAITPDLKGDIKTSQNSFLLSPVVTEELHNTNTGRNFWVSTENGAVWSAAGQSADTTLRKVTGKNADASVVDAGPGWFKVTRTNHEMGLEASITSFVPASGEVIELTVFKIKNISGKTHTITPTAAVPIYARSADNLRDHRQVTTLLNRVTFDEYGVINRPCMSFDERGHKENHLCYFVLGSDSAGNAPEGMWGDLNEFIGQGGSLGAPESIYKNTTPPENQGLISGREAIGALRFAKTRLEAGSEATFVVALGVSENFEDIESWKEKFLSADKANLSLIQTRKHWDNIGTSIRYNTADTDFDNWMVWVTCQPVFRKIFGCSFLPDFGYGRGGRGWRDLWQDCLALLLVEPDEARDLLLNNYAGVRADGSNATIIGTKPGEFLADRNNIPRTWMDHGVWPLLTTSLYIHQSGDIDILLQKQKYFKDAQAFRSRKKDTSWKPSDGTWLKKADGTVYEGTILEHLIIQNITQFFNVGAHNNLRLEGADWNDGLDMAEEKGESVAFSNMYSHNLKALADFIESLAAKGNDTIEFPEEMAMLFDTLTSSIDYSDPEKRSALLDMYMEKVSSVLSGKTVSFKAAQIVSDLKAKADFLAAHIRKQEYISVEEGFKYFNGYYNNDSQKVEGDNPHGVRMTLTGQVFPVMSGVADKDQVSECVKAVNRYLKDPKLGGYRLNTDFGAMQLNFGRAFSFAFGDKENGAFFSHMIVMWMFALYSRGFVNEGFEVLSSIYTMSVNSETSKIMPGLPEYFNSDGVGRYAYLTGSASWMLYTTLTQVMGVRGFEGNLLLHPKLTEKQFDEDGKVTVNTRFGGVDLRVEYLNKDQKGYNDYKVKTVSLNGKAVQFNAYDEGNGAVISKSDLQKADMGVCLIQVELA